MTTWKNVRRSSESATASTVAITGSKILVSACSPRAPIASDVTVTPSCIAAMNRAGSAVRPSTCLARRWPSSAISWRRVRRTVTSAYSAATKNPFSRMSAATATSSRASVMPRSPGPTY